MEMLRNRKFANIETLRLKTSLLPELMRGMLAFSDFPRGCCDVTAASIASKHSHEHISGVYIKDDGLAAPHSWNKIGNDIIDLTRSQFHATTPQIEIIDGRSPKARRYIEGIVAAY